MNSELYDWRTDGFRYGSTEEYAELTEGQKKPWTAELKIANTEIRIEATAPNGSKRHVWVELDQGVLKVHCYDNVHDEPACTVFLDEEQAFIRSGDHIERVHHLLRDEVMNLQACLPDFTPENKSRGAINCIFSLPPGGPELR